MTNSQYSFLEWCFCLTIIFLSVTIKLVNVGDVIEK